MLSAGESIHGPQVNVSTKRYIGQHAKRINHYNWRVAKKKDGGLGAPSDGIGFDPGHSTSSHQLGMKDGRKVYSDQVAQIPSYQDEMASSLNKDRKSNISQRRSIYNLFSKSKGGHNSGLHTRPSNLIERKMPNGRTGSRNSLNQSAEKVEPISPISVTVQGQIEQDHPAGESKQDVQSVQTSKLETSKFD